MTTNEYTTREAAAKVGVTVSRFHKLAAANDIEPSFRAPGLRGAKFWRPRDVTYLAAIVAAEVAA